MVQQRIAQYIEVKGIKQCFIASAIGVSPQTMVSIINGSRKLTADEYKSICEFLEVPYDRFMS